MTINQFLNILRRLRMDGHGNKNIRFCYDADSCSTEMSGEYEIDGDTIFFNEKNY